MVWTWAPSVRLRLPMLAGSLLLANCLADAVPSAAVTPGPSASGAALPAAVSNERALAERIEQRGREAFTGDLESPFRKPGNLAISPLSAGLTLVAADALLGPEVNRNAALSFWAYDVLGCFSVRQRNFFALRPGTPINSDGTRLAWRLMGGSDDPGRGSCHHVRTSGPFVDAFDNGMPDRVPHDFGWDEEANRPWSVTSMSGLDLKGPRIARAAISINTAHVWTLQRWGGFRNCQDRQAKGAGPQTPADLVDLLTLNSTSPLDRPAEPFPTGSDIKVVGYTERGVSEQILVLPIRVALREDARPRSLVVVLPDDPCPAQGLAFDAALRVRVEQAVAAPRETRMRVLLPRIDIDTSLALPRPAPLDTLIASASLYTLPSNATSLPPKDHDKPPPAPPGYDNIVIDRPFLFAVYDDATLFPLLFGRQETVKRMPVTPRRSPSPPSGSATGQGKLP